MAQRIAIIDPNPKDRHTLKTLLKRRGFDPFVPAQSAELLSHRLSLSLQFEMLAPLADSQLIIMENRLPASDGPTLIRLLKENKYTVQIPIMIVSDDGRYQSVLNCIQAGAEDYLVKPIEEQTLIRRIAMILGHRDPGDVGQGVESVILSFQEFLINELKRAERSRLEMSVILGRLSTPEEMQDEQRRIRNGKLQDLDLRLQVFENFVAGARQKVRQFDTLFRYGPQGMILVLPMTTRQGAFTVQQRLAHFFQREFIGDENLLIRRLELFTGVSSYPLDASSKHDLLLQAEKNLLSHKKAAVAGLGGESDETQVFWKAVFCPVCRTRFKVEKPRERAFEQKGRESDFRPLYEKGNPLYFAIPVCPNCYYGAFFSDFEQLNDMEKSKLRQAKSFRSRIGRQFDFRKARTLESAMGAYQLAAESYTKRKTPASTMARLYHRTAWLYREEGNWTGEKEMLQKAVIAYERAFLREDLTGKQMTDLDAAYMIGELSLRLEQYDRALEYFDNVIKSKSGIRKNLLDMARKRWYDTQEAKESRKASKK
jgi:uncharacterized protein